MKEIEFLLNTVAPLMNHEDEDWLILNEEADQITQWVPELVDIFFTTIYAQDATRETIQASEREAVEHSVTQWLGNLAHGFEQEQFWEQQWIMAIVHIQRDVKDIYMFALLNRLQQQVLCKCTETYDPEKASEVFNAFLRVTGMIMVVIARCYDIFQENVTEEGLAKVGMSPNLLQRIRDMQFNEMLERM